MGLLGFELYCARHNGKITPEKRRQTDYDDRNKMRTMMTDQSLRFTVRAEPRHAKYQNGYDADQHRYRANYVHPPTWRLYLQVEHADSAEAVEWTVSQVEGAFTQNVYADQAGCAEVVVPAQGAYRIEMIARDGEGERHSTAQTFTLRDRLIVVLGDSYVCGEGNPDEPGEPRNVLGTNPCGLTEFTVAAIEAAGRNIPMQRDAQWQEPLAHRSYQSGAARAVEALEAPTEGDLTTFVTFARSGSTIDNGLLSPMEFNDWIDIGQVEELKQTLGDRPIDALILSVGGNDVGYTSHLIDLIKDDFIWVGGVTGAEENRQQEQREADQRLEELSEHFARLADALEGVERRQTFILEYPEAHFDKLDEAGEPYAAAGCDIFNEVMLDIEQEDAQLIKKVGQQLNQVIRNAAERYGWTFVEGVAEGFAGHGYCADDPYFIRASESCRTQGNFDGTMHPNQQGHSVYADVIERALRRHLLDQPNGNEAA